MNYFAASRRFVSLPKIGRSFCIVLLATVFSGAPLFADRSPDTNSTDHDFDVVVYGATPGGIAAAVSAARLQTDSSVALVTPYRRVGGMMTNGLTHPDFRTFEARTGLFRELNQWVEDHYRKRYGGNSEQVRDSLRGTHAGPEVNYLAFRAMLDRQNIQVFAQHRLSAVESEGGRLRSVRFRSPGGPATLTGHYFVDGTYEGDLMAMAGVAFHVGREGKGVYGESLAPDESDNQLQGYNFRLTMTDRPDNRVPVPRPPGYEPDDYRDLLDMLRTNKIPQIFGDPYRGLKGGIYKRQTPALPNGKRDINDVSRSNVRLSLPNDNNAWPTGDEHVRQQIFNLHLRHNIGMLYFLQNDPAVPSRYAEEARRWGLCRDELTETGHIPEQLYVREARRMIGRYVFTQKDVERLPGSHHVRAIFHPDAIAMGDYGPNCHGTFHEGPRFGGRHTGEFYQRAAPYQIPYGVLLPKNVDNLAVPVACSASHAGFCALRLEPIWMSLGQAAGTAIGLALQQQAPLHSIHPAAIRHRLHANKTATIYTSDVPEESIDFRAVQWWGSLGGLIALDRSSSDPPAEYGKRGPQIIGQYYEAFPEHAVDLNQEMTPELLQQWKDVARKNGVPIPQLPPRGTRGDFIRAAWQHRHLPAGKVHRRLGQ